MVKGQKAMKRSLKQRKEAQRKYTKYTQQYNYLAGVGDWRMNMARREASKLMENWMISERMEMIPEEDEHQEERKQEIEGAPDLESRLEPQ